MNALWACNRAVLPIDLTGKRALVAGIADDQGFGFAIAKSLAEAGAEICAGTWPPAMKVFVTMLERGKFDNSLVLSSGEKMSFAKIYPLDADYDHLEDIPEDVRSSRRYRDYSDVSIAGVAAQMAQDFGSPGVDIVVHSLANGPEVKNSLLETSRKGYLAAMSTSAYSQVSMVRHFGPLMREGGAFLCLSYMAAERVVPSYGGGMSAAKAALEADTRYLAYEAGRRWGHRVNAISAGPYASRAASAISDIGRMIEHVSKHAPLPQALTTTEVGTAAAFLCSPLASGISGTIVHVDKGFHSMGVTEE